MIDLNALKSYMDFYKTNLARPNYSTGMGFNPTPDDPNGAAASWAMRAMGGNGPGGPNGPQDFFKFGAGNPGPAPGVQIGANPYSDRVQALQNDPYTQQPLNGQVTNYLSRLLKR